ncbi:MAG: DUF2325 domain-containing protein [Desulfovibrio sp.]|nr:DUF2325 domain-containing protein [Desulfovibrio sp.]
MCITLIGGMDRLKADYMAAARDAGHKLKCIAKNERNFTDKIGNPDLVLVFTNKISHGARDKALRAAKTRGIPFEMLHSCGVSSLREFLRQN